jgi:putative endopeptidase
MAWKAEVGGKDLPNREGFTPEQRFFIGYAQWACENPERVSGGIPRRRINGVLTNMPEFQRAFQCKAGQLMVPTVPEHRCRVW